MKELLKLKRILKRIDGKGYKAYKDIEGSYKSRDFFLFIDHVQGDPFASPSKIRIRVPMKEAKFPLELFSTKTRKIAFEDLISRYVRDAIFSIKRISGTGKSGLIYIDAGAQEVLERTACRITKDWVEIRLYVGLPAQGRKILATQAERIFFDQLIRIKDKGLKWVSYDTKVAQQFVRCVENQEYIRSRLKEKGIVAFIADDSLLPRERGNSDLPMSFEKAVLFKSPETLRIEFELPNPTIIGGQIKNKVSGMGIPKGVTLIVGGGYHGKSTLIQSIERGIYPHIPGDGREYVVTIPTAVKIKAEEGRRVEKVDISPFINNLPGGIDTASFSTDNASGSTSQAANIMEAIEMGAELLLLDEDTSATNFMIRDVRMQELVSKENEPITPFIDRVQELYKDFNVSTILVMGGCGDYFDVADTVIMMQEYIPYNVTLKAREIAKRYATKRKKEVKKFESWGLRRIPLKEDFRPYRGRTNKIKIEAKDRDHIIYGNEIIDLRGVEQVVDVSQARAIGMAIYQARRLMDNRKSLKKVLKQLDELIEKEGLDILDPFYKPSRHPGSFSRPRIFEIAAAMNRIRSAIFTIE